MSGQPVRKPSDIIAFRNAYMEELEMQDQINSENLEANKVYKATGSLPAKSTITDTRTTSEILADVEGMKITLITTLKPLFNPSTASQVLQRIERSPLNKDGSLFTFFAQRADEFVLNLQRMYKYGIKGDENDIEQFVAFIEKAFSSTKTMASTVRGYFDSAKSAQSSMSQGEIDKYNNELNIFNLNLISKMYSDNRPKVESTQSKQLINQVKNFINEHIRMINSEKYVTFIKNVSDAMRTTQEGRVSFYRAEVSRLYEQFQDYMKLLPSINNLNTLFIQLERSLINKEPQLTDEIVLELYQMFPPEETLHDLTINLSTIVQYLETLDIELDDMNELSKQYAKDTYDMRPPQPYSSGPAPILAIDSQPPPPPIRMIPEKKLPKYGPPPPPPPKPPPPTIDRDEQFAQISLELFEKLEVILDNNLDLQTQDDFDEVDDILDKAYDEHMYHLMDAKPRDFARAKTIEYVNRRIDAYFGDPLPVNVFGQGLKKRRGRPKGCGIKKTFDDYKDPDLGIKSKTPFISFGKHFINNNKLQDGVISLRHKSGAGLPNLPSRKVSPNLSGIIKTIVGGGMPSYNDVDKLSDEEKNYLHQISKKSDLTQMLAIPAPSKDKMEKDFNQFEIMKGEIMAGNDSKDLIKKFKVLLLKLVNTGQLPKQQVQEIMTVLLEMGY